MWWHVLALLTSKDSPNVSWWNGPSGKSLLHKAQWPKFDPLIPRCKERTDFPKLLSDLHMCTKAHLQPSTSTHALSHIVKKQKHTNQGERELNELCKALGKWLPPGKHSINGEVTTYKVMWPSTSGAPAAFEKETESVISKPRMCFLWAVFLLSSFSPPSFFELGLVV